MKAYNTPTVEVIGTIADLTNGATNNGSFIEMED
jgi:hypothetical protein